MYNPQPAEYTAYSSGISVAERGAIIGKVLTLLGFSFLFTAVGAYVGIQIGYAAFWISLIGTFACLFGSVRREGALTAQPDPALRVRHLRRHDHRAHPDAVHQRTAWAAWW